MSQMKTLVLAMGLSLAARGAVAQAPEMAMAQAAMRQAAPPAAWPQDPGDSLYRAGREALNAGRYERAATAFERIADRYARSAYAGDALYWAAFARYRLGGSSNLQAAQRRLTQQTDRYPKATTRKDGDVLDARINGALARRGEGPDAEPGARAP